MPKLWEIIVFAVFGLGVLALMFGPMIGAWWVSRSTWKKPE
jgi:hypothetical protein